VQGLQQLSGPVMAKSVEDTAFYRYSRLLALNEVGGEPDAEGLTLSAFHRRAAERLELWPATLLATATHDTKRGEDARVRLAVLSEVPGVWNAEVRRWRELNAPHRAGQAVISAKDEYALYQTLVGVWPPDLAPSGDGGEGIAELRQRLAGWLQKHLREGKERSSWGEPNEAYEQTALAFLDTILDPRQAGGFLAALVAFAGRIGPAAAANGLTQLLLKLTAPGVPDIYQGNELWDFALVDPDNRRPVDFAALERGLVEAHGEQPAPAELLVGWRDGRVKQAVLARALAVRNRLPALFAHGAYRPLRAMGRHADRILAFARMQDEGEDVAAAVTVVGRRLAPLLLREEQGTEDVPLVEPATWADTALVLPAEWQDRAVTLVDALTGAEIEPEDGRLGIARLLQCLPIALLLVRQGR
jgi:(1->4)-alpha-D-glucan 1-alpha-D-glucosylmutase